MGNNTELGEVAAASYEQWRAGLHERPEYQRIYDEEAAKGDLWLQLVEARQAAGLTQAQLAGRLGVSQAQVARIEKRGYHSHSINSLRKYVHALGEGFSLDIKVRCPESHPTKGDVALRSNAAASEV